MNLSDSNIHTLKKHSLETIRTWIRGLARADVRQMIQGIMSNWISFEHAGVLCGQAENSLSNYFREEEVYQEKPHLHYLEEYAKNSMDRDGLSLGSLELIGQQGLCQEINMGKLIFGSRPSPGCHPPLGHTPLKINSPIGSPQLYHVLGVHSFVTTAIKKDTIPPTALEKALLYSAGLPKYKHNSSRVGEMKDLQRSIIA